MAEFKYPNLYYRFRPNTSLHFEDDLDKAINRNRVWFNPASSQNDPFEGLPTFEESNFRDVTDYLREFRKHFGKEVGYTGSDVRAKARSSGIRKSDLKNFFDDPPTMARSILRTLPHSFKDIRKSTVFSSFTEEFGSPLQWAHYANSGKGVCLQFEYLPCRGHGRPGKMVKVGYSKNRPTISTIEGLKYVANTRLGKSPFFDDYNSIETMEKLVLTKSLDWAHEKEWRWVHFEKRGAGYKSISPLRVTKIFVGYNAGKQVVETCEKVSKGKIPIVRTALDKTLFEIIPKEA